MDPDLVKRARKGEEQAFEALTVISHPRLFRLAYAILRQADLAEQATQRACLDIWRSLPRLREPAGFPAWSARLLVEACRETRADVPTDTAEETFLPAPDVGGDPFGTIVDRDRLAGSFRELPFDDRALLVLRYLDELGADEAGAALGLKGSKVEARTRAALAALDASLEGDSGPVLDLKPQLGGA